MARALPWNRADIGSRNLVTLASMPVFSVNLGRRLKFLNPGDPEALEALDRLSRRTLQALKNDQSVARRHVGIIT